MYQKKGFLILLSLLFLAMFCIPFLSTGKRPQQSPKQKSGQPAQSSSLPSSSLTPASGGRQFKILDSKSGQILTVDDRTFLYGAVAAEMSPLAEPEALRAQAVACYTYYGRLRETQRQSSDPSLKGADFTADTQEGMAYVSRELMQKRWGASFDADYKKLVSAVDPVYGKVLKSGGALIDATYFAISSGNTEASQDVWGGSCPYLVSVASPGDVFAGGYQTSVVLPADQLKSKLLSIDPKANLSGDPTGWFGTPEKTAAGMVKSITAGGQTLTGSQLRNALDLRSSNFTVSYSNGNFTFTVKGYGHDVGMSQAGAQ